MNKVTRIDVGKAMWADLAEAGLTEMRICDMAYEQMCSLASIVLRHSLLEERLPAYHGKGNLTIPFSAPARYRLWEQKLSDKEKRELLLEMGVPEEDLPYFMSQRAIDVALGLCDAKGRPLISKEDSDAK